MGVASCITTMCDCKTCPPSLLRAPIPSFLSVKPDTNTDTNTELGKRRRNLGTSKALDDEATEFLFVIFGMEDAKPEKRFELAPVV